TCRRSYGFGIRCSSEGAFLGGDIGGGVRARVGVRARDLRARDLRARDLLGADEVEEQGAVGDEGGAQVLGGRLRARAGIRTRAGGFAAAAVVLERLGMRD